jgi:hypothetical protein
LEQAAQEETVVLAHLIQFQRLAAEQEEKPLAETLAVLEAEAEALFMVEALVEEAETYHQLPHHKGIMAAADRDIQVTPT